MFSGKILGYPVTANKNGCCDTEKDYFLPGLHGSKSTKDFGKQKSSLQNQLAPIESYTITFFQRC